MGHTADLLDQVRAQLAPTDEALREARRRRDIAKDAASSFRGALRSFNSGSLAHGTANCPIHQRDKGLDADCGVVLDRRVYHHLGPDGLGVGPNSIVGEVLDHIQGKVFAEYPYAELTLTKRAIFITPNSPLSTGEDPTVDLVVALSRRADDALWIPNMEQDRWDPSHPERHTELLTSEPAELRRVRAHAIRLAKAENKRTIEPSLCSFNIEALGWMFVHEGIGDATRAASPVV